MKKLICLVISAVLFCTLCCTTALAVGAKYQNTKRFVQLLDEIGIRYTIEGVEDNEERVTVKNRDDKSSYTIFTTSTRMRKKWACVSGILLTLVIPITTVCFAW